MRYFFFAFLFVVISVDAQKMVVIEKFTNTSCGQCPDASLVLEDLVSRYDNLIWVSHYKNNGWFDNPLTNDQTAQLWDDVLVPGNPLGMIDRIPIDDFLFLTSSRWEDRIIEQLSEPTMATVDVADVEYNQESRELSFDINAVFDAAVPIGDYRITVMIVEDNVIGSSQNSYFNEVAGHPLEGRGDIIWDYVHSNVVRAILDDTWGTRDVIPTIPDIGVDYTHRYSYTVPEEYRAAHLRIVFMINKFDEADILKREVLNSNQVRLTDVLWQLTSVEETGLEQVDIVSVYPNPASDKLYIDDHYSSYAYSITDVNGRVLQSLSSISKNYIDVTDIENGIYFISFNNESESRTLKFSVKR